MELWTRKPGGKYDSLLYCTFARCVSAESFFGARTGWPSWLIWIIAVFAQIVEILSNLAALSSHKATSKATNIALLSKHITEKACETVASAELPSRLTSLWACCIFAGRKCSHKQTGLCPKPSSSCLSSYSRPRSPSFHPPHNGSSLIKHRSEFWHHTWDGKVERAAKYYEEEDKKPWGVYF